MKQLLLQRRTEMLNYLCKGIPFNQIVDDFTTKYNVSKEAIYNDWRRRDTWMPQVTQINDPNVINELLQGLKQIIPNAWFEYKQSDNPAARVGALRVLKETYLSIIEVLQSIGRLEKTPTKIEVIDNELTNMLAEYEQVIRATVTSETPNLPTNDTAESLDTQTTPPINRQNRPNRQTSTVPIA